MITIMTNAQLSKCKKKYPQLEVAFRYFKRTEWTSKNFSIILCAYNIEENSIIWVGISNNYNGNAIFLSILDVNLTTIKTVPIKYTPQSYAEVMEALGLNVSS